METAADPFPSDDAAMAHAVALAERGRGAVEPNPCVGAVLTTPDRRLIVAGWHERFGGPHAEPNALQSAGERARGATLFVTLEPCSHDGKTPPCADAVIAAGVSRVVIGTEDPAPHVAGGGIDKLCAAGIAVEVGVLEDECRTLSAPFFKWLAVRRPWVTAKWAMTLDGKTASRTGDSKWISSVQSRALVHRWRGGSGAVVVGAGTVRMDDPHLAPRCQDFGLPAAPRVPLRVVVSPLGRLPSTCRLARTPEDGPVLVTAVEGAADWPLPDHVERLVLPPAPHDPRQIDVLALLDALAARDVYRVFLEGGGTTAGSWLDQGQIDEVRAFVAPKLLSGEGATTPLEGEGFPTVNAAPVLRGLRAEPVGDDLLITALTNIGESPGDFWFDSALQAGQRSAQHEPDA